MVNSEEVWYRLRRWIKIVPKAHLTYSLFTFTSYFKNRAAEQPDFLSSSALGAMVSPDGGQLGVGFGHECLQLLLKQLVRGLGSGRLHRGSGALRTVILVLGTVLETAFGAGRTVTGAETTLTGCVLTLRLGFQTLDGQIDLAVLVANDHDLHILTLGQMLADIADIGVGHLGNMYQTGLIFG